MQLKMILNSPNLSSKMPLVALLLGEGRSSKVLLVVVGDSCAFVTGPVCQCTEGASGLVQVVP